MNLLAFLSNRLIPIPRTEPVTDESGCYLDMHQFLPRATARNVTRQNVMCRRVDQRHSAMPRNFGTP